MTGPAVIGFDCAASICVISIRLRLEGLPKGLPSLLTQALERAPLEAASLAVGSEATGVSIVVLTQKQSEVGALEAVCEAIAGATSGLRVPATIVGRGQDVREHLAHVRWPSELVGPPMQTDAPAVLGAVFEVDARRRLHGAITFAASGAASPDHAAENLVAAVWLGARDSPIMRNLREDAGLLYFPIMEYVWHPVAPAWQVTFEGDAARAGDLRRHLVATTRLPAPVGDLPAHVANSLRSLDVAEISPDAQLSLGHQLLGQGLSTEWLADFRKRLENITEHEFAAQWNRVMARIRETVDA